jgi:hypothetical protein
MRCSITLWQFGLKQLLVLLQKVIGLPFLSALHAESRIACKADHFSNLSHGELNLEYNKMDASLKFCLPSAVFMLMKVYPTIPLSGRSNLVRRYLYSEGVGCLARITPRQIKQWFF